MADTSPVLLVAFWAPTQSGCVAAVTTGPLPLPISCPCRTAAQPQPAMPSVADPSVKISTSLSAAHPSSDAAGRHQLLLQNARHTRPRCTSTSLASTHTRVKRLRSIRNQFVAQIHKCETARDMRETAVSRWG
eukprot:1455399-Prymnesium_polylepis.1